jgi:hypothetical protein
VRRKHVPSCCGIRSGLLSSFSTLKSGVEDLCSDLASSNVSEQADGPISLDVLFVTSVAVLGRWPVAFGSRRVRHRKRRAITRRATNKKRAETAPVMMATKGLMAISLADGCGRGRSPVRNGTDTRN